MRNVHILLTQDPLAVTAFVGLASDITQHSNKMLFSPQPKSLSIVMLKVKIYYLIHFQFSINKLLG